MGLGSWGLLVLVVVPLLQVPGMILLSRYVERDDESIRPHPIGYEVASGVTTARAAPGTVTCARCRTDNDDGYQYCRACAARLR